MLNSIGAPILFWIQPERDPRATACSGGGEDAGGIGAMKNVNDPTVLLSPQNVWRMLQFFRTYTDNLFLSQPVRELITAVPWGHHAQYHFHYAKWELSVPVFSPKIFKAKLFGGRVIRT
jgi:hypothetical protein